MKGVNTQERINYIITFGAIAYSGIHFFSMPVISKLLFFVLLTILFFRRGLKIDPSIIYVSIAFSIILLTQHILFAKFKYMDYFEFLLPRVFTSYLLIKILGLRFPYYYIRVIYVYSIISLIFWSLSNTFPAFTEFISQIPRNWNTDPHETVDQQFIIYTYEPHLIDVLGLQLYRNPGPFIEPGAWGLYLILAFAFKIMENKGSMDKISYVLIITIISTFSTATLLSFFVLFIYLVSRTRISLILKVPVYIFVFYISVQSFYTFAFMYEKIEKRYSWEMDKPLYGVMGGRFYGARKAIYVLNKYPLTGRAMTESTQPKDEFSKEYVRYGIMSQASQTGLILFFLYLMLLLLSLKRYSRWYNYRNNFYIFIYIALLISMFAQDFGLKPVFMMLIFTPLIFKPVDSEQQK